MKEKKRWVAAFLEVFLSNQPQFFDEKRWRLWWSNYSARARLPERYGTTGNLRKNGLAGAVFFQVGIG